MGAKAAYFTASTRRSKRPARQGRTLLPGPERAARILELRLHPHPQRAPRCRHEALRQRVQVVAVGEVLQRHVYRVSKAL